MSNNEADNSASKSPEPSGTQHSAWIPILVVGLILALAGNVFLLVRSSHMDDRLAQISDSTTAQIAKAGTDTSAMMQQRLDQINDTLSEGLKGAHDTAASAIKQARSEIKKQSTQLADRLDEQQKQVSGELTELKDATTDASSKINEVSTNVDGVKTDVNGVRTDVDAVKTNVASTQTEVERHAAELKRVTGDMGVMSGLIATNSKDLSVLRELGERNYIEFDLNKRDASKKVGDVILTLKKSDPKRSRYTLAVVADDKTTEKRDRTINEPVQLYVADNRQPYEIVVNQVKKDEVVGYLATPKMKVARR